jgi:hypothetical protein
MKRREVLTVFRIGIMRLLAPDVSGSISAAVDDMVKRGQRMRQKQRFYREGRGGGGGRGRWKEGKE